MADTITLIRWKHRRGKRTPYQTLWHVRVDSLSNRFGRTGCGKRYARAAKVEERADPVPDDEMCLNCALALESEPEHA